MDSILEAKCLVRIRVGGVGNHRFESAHCRRRIVGAGQAAIAGAQGVAESKSAFLGSVITELLVAGGSGAMFTIFTKLKLRDSGKLPENPQTAHEEAAARKARRWPRGRAVEAAEVRDTEESSSQRR